MKSCVAAIKSSPLRGVTKFDLFYKQVNDNIIIIILLYIYIYIICIIYYNIYVNMEHNIIHP